MEELKEMKAARNRRRRARIKNSPALLAEHRLKDKLRHRANYKPLEGTAKEKSKAYQKQYRARRKSDPSEYNKWLEKTRQLRKARYVPHPRPVLTHAEKEARAEEQKIRKRIKANAHYAENRDELRARQRAKKYKKSAAAIERNKRWMKENIETVKRWRKEGEARFLSNPKNRMAKNLRLRLYTLVSSYRSGNTKNATASLVSCSKEELRAHIEGQFTRGMTWENYGEWHVDHIRPCVSFDLTDQVQQNACFHFTNLRPLWATENLAKKDNWSGQIVMPI